jgi:hypothetical protein
VGSVVRAVGREFLRVPGLACSVCVM